MAVGCRRPCLCPRAVSSVVAKFAVGVSVRVCRYSYDKYAFRAIIRN